MATVTAGKSGPEAVLERLKKERTQIRRMFTVSVTQFETSVESKDEVDNISDCFCKVSNKAERLFNLDEQIKEIILSGEVELSEEDMSTEFDSIESYYDRWLTVKSRYERLIRAIEPVASMPRRKDSTYDSSESFQVAEGFRRKYQLPKIEFEKFDGNVRNWINFWGQFRKIHEDDDIDEDDKYRYLLLATTGIANSVVKKYPSSGYRKAINHLNSRFGKDEILIEVYVRDLLGMVVQKTRSNLAELFDQLETQLGALELLGVTSEKYACMLYPIVESALPEDVLKAWERNRTSKRDMGESKEPSDYLKLLLEFIRCEVESEERIRLAKTGFPVTADKKTKSKKVSEENDDLEPTAASLAATTTGGKNVECFFCARKNHASVDCFRVSKLTYDERKERVLKFNGCLICLKRGHYAKNCKTFMKCIICSKKHHVIMCPDTRNDSAKQQAVASSVVSEGMQVGANSPTLLQTLRVRIPTTKGAKIIRALLDTGSQKSYITKKCAVDLGLKKVGEENLALSLFGGVQTGKERHNIYCVNVCSIERPFKIVVPVLEQEKICNFVPCLDSVECISELRKRDIVLSDVGGSNAEISLLLGADIIGKLMTGEVQELPNGLTAIKTKLGWTVMGQCKYSSNVIASTHVSTCFLSIDISELWRLDVLGITDPSERKTAERLAEETLEHFRRTVSRNQANRYEVRLPWKDGRPSLSDNHEVAVKRLKSTTRKLKALSKMKDYHKVFSDWLDLEIIEPVPEIDEGNREGCHYIPHQAIIKEARVTTKIRPVFDASARDINGNSLNSCLANGPNLLKKIPNLLLHFRQNAIGVISDITKAFLQISIAPSDRDFLRFLWWEDEKAEKIITYRHCRVVFGLTPSPFLLEATIAHHLENVPVEFQETANRLKNTFYVDNSIVSVNTKEELDNFIREAKKVMELGGFDLRGWVSSLSEQGACEFTEKETVSVLGLLWNYKLDVLYCDVSSVSLTDKPLTRRKLLSVAQRIFDPIGFTCPVTLIPKLLLQQTWELKCGWDDDLPQYITQKFENWLGEIHWLNHCQIPRWVTLSCLSSNVSVHVFTDGSKEAYSACIFVRAEYNNEVSVQLVSAKSRIAPLKKLTIPRMELMGAVIGARLYCEVKGSLQVPFTSYFWTDSLVVLTWLTWKNDWNTFVSNRCREIAALTTTEWKHVPGEINPADLPSRGCNGERLLHSSWWEGPEWLKKRPTEWPSRIMETPEEEALTETRKTAMSVLTCQLDHFLGRLSKLSCYFRVIRVAAWVRRGLRKFKNLKQFRVSNKSRILPSKREELSCEEIEEAELRVLQCVQEEGFGARDRKMFKKLQSYQDGLGVLRIRSRLLPDEEGENFANPILLPASHSIVTKLIMSEHIQANHAGSQILMCILRQRYWITKARKMIRGVLSKCAKCQRFKAKAADPPVAPLPKDRVTMGGVFEVSGVDFAGPLQLRDKSKVWIVLFTCAVYRAVHLELTTSLSTDAFLQVLRRFVARRGRIRVIYSDNGTNFVGAYNTFQSLDWDKVISQANIKRIQWKFNPPAAPWWGGWWERLIGLMKDLLRRNLGRASLSFEELTTVLCDCEATLNSRPLTYIYQEPEGLQPLTPAHFIHLNSHGSEVTDIDAADSNSMRKRLQYVQKIRDGLRQRFRNEYLAMLVHHADRKTRTLKVGDVVLIGTDNVKRINWPLGVITELCPGQDGQHRVAKVRTAKSELIRAFQRLYPLEVDTSFGKEVQDECFQKCKGDGNQKKDTKEASNTTTGSGRLIKKPARLGD